MIFRTGSNFTTDLIEVVKKKRAIYLKKSLMQKKLCCRLN
jgi:hypothetical protein